MKEWAEYGKAVLKVTAHTDKLEIKTAGHWAARRRTEEADRCCAEKQFHVRPWDPSLEAKMIMMRAMEAAFDDTVLPTAALPHRVYGASGAAGAIEMRYVRSPDSGDACGRKRQFMRLKEIEEEGMVDAERCSDEEFDRSLLRCTEQTTARLEKFQRIIILTLASSEYEVAAHSRTVGCSLNTGGGILGEMLYRVTRGRKKDLIKWRLIRDSDEQETDEHQAALESAIEAQEFSISLHMAEARLLGRQEQWNVSQDPHLPPLQGSDTTTTGKKDRNKGKREKKEKKERKERPAHNASEREAGAMGERDTSMKGRDRVATATAKSASAKVTDSDIDGVDGGRYEDTDKKSSVSLNKQERTRVQGEGGSGEGGERSFDSASGKFGEQVSRKDSEKKVGEKILSRISSWTGQGKGNDVEAQRDQYGYEKVDVDGGHTSGGFYRSVDQGSEYDSDDYACSDYGSDADGDSGESKDEVSHDVFIDTEKDLVGKRGDFSNGKKGPILVFPSNKPKQQKPTVSAVSGKSSTGLPARRRLLNFPIQSTSKQETKVSPKSRLKAFAKTIARVFKRPLLFRRIVVEGKPLVGLAPFRMAVLLRFSSTTEELDGKETFTFDDIGLIRSFTVQASSDPPIALHTQAEEGAGEITVSLVVYVDAEKSDVKVCSSFSVPADQFFCVQDGPFRISFSSQLQLSPAALALVSPTESAMLTTPSAVGSRSQWRAGSSILSKTDGNKTIKVRITFYGDAHARVMKSKGCIGKSSRKSNSDGGIASHTQPISTTTAAHVTPSSTSHIEEIKDFHGDRWAFKKFTDGSMNKGDPTATVSDRAENASLGTLRGQPQSASAPQQLGLPSSLSQSQSQPAESFCDPSVVIPRQLAPLQDGTSRRKLTVNTYVGSGGDALALKGTDYTGTAVATAYSVNITEPLVDGGTDDNETAVVTAISPTAHISFGPMTLSDLVSSQSVDVPMRRARPNSPLLHEPMTIFLSSRLPSPEIFSPVETRPVRWPESLQNSKVANMAKPRSFSAGGVLNIEASRNPSTVFHSLAEVRGGKIILPPRRESHLTLLQGVGGQRKREVLLPPLLPVSEPANMKLWQFSTCDEENVPPKIIEMNIPFAFNLSPVTLFSAGEKQRSPFEFTEEPVALSVSLDSDVRLERDERLKIEAVGAWVQQQQTDAQTKISGGGQRERDVGQARTLWVKVQVTVDSSSDPDTCFAPGNKNIKLIVTQTRYAQMKIKI